jgi:hypothetical protein
MVEIGKYMVNLTSIFEREKTQYYKALADAEIKICRDQNVEKLSASEASPPVCTADCWLPHVSILSLFPHVCCLTGVASYRLSTVIDYEYT